MFGHESNVVSVRGADSGLIRMIIGQQSALVVNYTDGLIESSFNASLDGKDVTDYFYDEGEPQHLIKLPLEPGDHTLLVSARFEEDAESGEWYNCDLNAPRRWRSWTIRVAPVEGEVSARRRIISREEADAWMMKHKGKKYRTPEDD